MTWSPQAAFLVSHTHWDREWYLTFHQFRVMLTRVVRRVLDQLETEEAFRHFVLDGQSIVLEDYLRVHPEDENRVRRLVGEGKLAIGPWYILPDEFLVSGEATVRNLILGHGVASHFGPVQTVGYMPDSFGHLAQMPQILRSVGIDSFVYTRGNGSEIDDLGHEYLWRSPDGSEVLAVNQCGGYCNAAGLGHEEIWHSHTRRSVDPGRAVTQVRELFEKMSAGTNAPVVLLNNGCDHFPPQRDFTRVLAALEEAFPETSFRHGSLSEFIEALRAADVSGKRFTGELLGGRHHHILSGVWSARMGLKQRNARAQSLLSRIVEPAASYTHFLHDREYPHGLLHDAWKQLLANHPHDSICGCSIDEVHRDMEPRFRGVIETAEKTLHGELEHLTPAFARRAEGDRDTVLTVFNPLPLLRDEIIERMVILQPPAPAVDSLELVDEVGVRVPFEIVSHEVVERFWGIDYRAELWGDRQRERFEVYRKQFGHRILRPSAESDRHDSYVWIRFLAAGLPGVGHRSYFLRPVREVSSARPAADPGESPEASAELVPVHLTGHTMENEHLAVTLHENGTFDVTCRATGRVLRGLNQLEDTEDVGDEYDYSPAAESVTVTSNGAGGTVRRIAQGSLAGALEARFVLALPAGVTIDRDARCEDSVDCEVRVAVRLEARSRRVEVTTSFINAARDHRLRAVFPSGIRTDRILSDGQFLGADRPIAIPDDTNWAQPHPGTFPQQDFSLVSDGHFGLAILNRGLPEIAATRAEDGTVRMHLTLLRAVGWLSRDDFPTRRHQNAGPTIPTPDAQCLGPQRFEYSVLPFEGDWIEAGVKRESEVFQAPLPSIQGIADLHVPGGPGLVRISSGRTTVTAIKRTEDRNSLIVRLYNLSSDPVREMLEFGTAVASAWRTNLLEVREERLPAEGTRVTVSAGPCQIVTVEVELS